MTRIWWSHEGRGAVVIHVAGPMVEWVQRCARCGEVISDYRHSMIPEGDPAPRGWTVGAHVEVDGIQPRLWWLTTDAPTCVDRSAHSKPI